MLEMNIIDRMFEMLATIIVVLVINSLVYLNISDGSTPGIQK